MKKHFSVALVTESEIAAAGIAAILTHIQGLHLNIIRYNSGTACESIIDNQHSLAILDPLAMPRAEIRKLRGSMRVMALRCSLTPQSLNEEVDGSISIYDTIESIVKPVKELLTTADREKEKCDLSPRERDVVVSIVKGLSNKEIADTLNISVNTVMTHRRNIASKLQIHSPAGLTIYAIMNKLINLSDISS